MTKKINVIDLDKTLISFDSFEIIIKKEIFKLNLVIFFYTFLRLLRLVTLARLKKEAVLNLRKKYDNSYFKSIALNLYKNIDSQVLTEIEKETDNNTINILLSASPNIYVKYLIDKLKWQGTGSYFTANGNFIHLHGLDKVDWLKNKYKLNEFDYNFAISDSSTDDELLKLFKRKIKWTSHSKNIKN